MNEKVLLEVSDLIVRKYDNFDMFSFVNGKDILHLDSENECGTTACIAGWTIVTKHGYIDSTEKHEYQNNFFSQASEILELTTNQAIKLFYFNNWPKKFYMDYTEAYLNKNRKQCAIVTKERIKHFLFTKGEE